MLKRTANVGRKHFIGYETAREYIRITHFRLSNVKKIRRIFDLVKEEKLIQWAGVLRDANNLMHNFQTVSSKWCMGDSYWCSWSIEVYVEVDASYRTRSGTMYPLACIARFMRTRSRLLSFVKVISSSFLHRVEVYNNSWFRWISIEEVAAAAAYREGVFYQFISCLKVCFIA